MDLISSREYFAGVVLHPLVALDLGFHAYQYKVVMSDQLHPVMKQF